MAYAFKTISAKPTFGTLTENLYQSDYINRKKRATLFCKSPCQRIKVVSNYNTKNLFNIGVKCNMLHTNKSNLIIGQYTKENLNNICTVSFIDSSVKPAPCGTDANCNPCQNNTPIVIDLVSIIPFYHTYQIDPLGELFGNTQCGELNYTRYMEFK
jgi:hypothetical protein